jgi:predicted phage terminase large subunit-like protein
MYLLDCWRKQSASDEWIESFCDLVTEWKPIGWAEEKGQISASIGPALDRRCRERKAYIYREQFPTRGDKAVRAQSIRGLMALEGLYVPINAPWYQEFKSELLSFPAGKHDDQVDALGLIGQLLDQMVPGPSARDHVRPENDVLRYNRAYAFPEEIRLNFIGTHGDVAPALRAPQIVGTFHGECLGHLQSREPVRGAMGGRHQLAARCSGLMPPKQKQKNNKARRTSRCEAFVTPFVNGRHMRFMPCALCASAPAPWKFKRVTRCQHA